MELTGFALLAAGIVAVYLAFRAADHARSSETRVMREVSKLMQQGARLTALEGAHQSLLRQHQKLAGMFHADRRATPPPPNPTPDLPDLVELEPCYNWQVAQIEGPRSDAAQCECGYCTHQRNLRAQTKRTLTPKGQPARIDAMRRGQET